MKRCVTNLVLCLAFALSAVAISPRAGAEPDREARRLTLSKLMVPITLELNNTRLEDLIQFLRDFTGANIDALWLDDRAVDGLDKDKEITISVRDVSVLQLLERVLDKSSTDLSGATWQLADDGTLEIGPKARLNQSAFLKMYDVQDMLYEVKNFPAVPTLDLDQILQQSQQGGGGGGSIFADDDTGEGEALTEEELVDRLIEIITTSVESEQWFDNGGDGASIRYYNGSLLIRAPDYIHRQLGGYPFWDGKYTARASAISPVDEYRAEKKREAREAREAIVDGPPETADDGPK